MNDFVQALKDIFATMEAFGWQPIPSLIAVLLMMALRSYFEPGVLDINSKEELARVGRIKLYVFAGVFVGSGIMQIGMSRPASAFDWCTSIGFSLGHTCVGYVVSSSTIVRDFVGRFLPASAASRGGSSGDGK